MYYNTPFLNEQLTNLKCLVLCRLNDGPFEEEKPPITSHGSHVLDDEEAEQLGADEEEGEEPSSTSGKPESEELPGNLSDDIMQDEMDFSGPNDLNLNCKPSPRR